MMHISIGLYVLLGLASGSTFASDIPALPRSSAGSICLNLLRTAVVGDRPARTFIGLNDVVRRSNRVILVNLPMMKGNAGATLDRHFTDAFDVECKRRDVGQQIELIARTLDYDDYDEPESFLTSGPRDTPLRVNGQFPREEGERVDMKPVSQLNSRELLVLIDGAGAWSAFRNAQTRRLLDRLEALATEHPDHFADAFAAAAIPLKFNVDLKHDVVFGVVGRMLGHVPIDVAQKVDVLAREVDVLQAVLRQNRALAVNLSWGSSPSREELAVAKFFKGVLEKQEFLIQGAVYALQMMSATITTDNARVLR